MAHVIDTEKISQKKKHIKKRKNQASRYLEKKWWDETMGDNREGEIRDKGAEMQKKRTEWHSRSPRIIRFCPWSKVGGFGGWLMGLIWQNISGSEFSNF